MDGDGLMLIDEDGIDATSRTHSLLESVGSPPQTIAIAVSLVQILSLSATPVPIVDVYSLVAVCSIHLLFFFIHMETR
jgi:hypothetical protein